jgi:formamidopyrimidine-DNA glycosylase
MYLAAKSTPATRHTTIEFGLGRQKLVFEDLRRFGGMTLDPSAIGRLGPEPLEPEFTTNVLVRALHRSKQPIKIKLMDQSAVAGIGNIYASEALFLASIHPATAAASLDQPMIRRLRNSIRRILREAIKFGSTLPLDFGGVGSKSGLFYYGAPAGNSNAHQERLRVYDRTGEPCTQCGKPIRKLVQAARSTFYCPVCQPEL